MRTIGVSDTDQMEEKAKNSYIYHDVYIEESLEEVLDASLRCEVVKKFPWEV